MALHLPGKEQAGLERVRHCPRASRLSPLELRCKSLPLLPHSRQRLAWKGLRLPEGLVVPTQPRCSTLCEPCCPLLDPHRQLPISLKSRGCGLGWKVSARVTQLGPSWSASSVGGGAFLRGGQGPLPTRPPGRLLSSKEGLGSFPSRQGLRPWLTFAEQTGQ